MLKIRGCLHSSKVALVNWKLRISNSDLLKSSLISLIIFSSLSITAERRTPRSNEKQKVTKQTEQKKADEKSGEKTKEPAKTPEEKRRAQLASMHQKILFASSTERRNEIRKVKALAEDERKEFYPELIKIVTADLDPSVRESTVRILSELKVKEAEPAFIAALCDKQDDVQLAAVSGLREIESKAAAAPLGLMLKDLDPKKDHQMFSSILKTLGVIDSKADIPYLLKTVEQTETHEEVKRAIVLYLGDIKAAESREFLIKLLKNEEKEPEMRAYAVNSLGRMKEQTAVPVIKDILESIRNLKNPKDRARLNRLRYQGTVALIRLGDRSMLPEVISAAKDDDPSVRLRAIRQLGEMKVPESKDLLEYKSKYDDNVRVKKAAADALAHWGDSPGKNSGLEEMDDANK